jgi:hypothetical protein
LEGRGILEDVLAINFVEAALGNQVDGLLKPVGLILRAERGRRRNMRFGRHGGTVAGLTPHHSVRHHFACLIGFRARRRAGAESWGTD